VRRVGAQLSATVVSAATEGQAAKPLSGQEHQPHPSGVQIPPGKFHHLPAAGKEESRKAYLSLPEEQCLSSHSPLPKKFQRNEGATSVQCCLDHTQHQATWWATAYQGNWGFLELSEEAK